MTGKGIAVGWSAQKKVGSSETRVPSVDRALDLLELLALSDHGLTLSEVSRKLQIPRSSAHYLIQSLACRGYLERNPAGRDYVLGLRVANFAHSVAARSQLKMISSPYLRDIVKESGLTAQLGVLDGAEALVIDRVDAPTGMQLDSWVGRHFELHCTALGKALIAYLSDAEVEKLFEGRGLSRHNPNTLCSMEAVRAQLAEVRIKGYALDNEEHEIGVRCLAAPIFNYLGSAVAAICVFSSASKFTSWRVSGVGNKIVSVAVEISRHIREPLILRPLAPPSSSAVIRADQFHKPDRPSDRRAQRR
jgi:IclR family transcriptional regulator, KDG regulon repressor